MYQVLEPFEKLIYLSFWVDPATGGAVRRVFGAEVAGPELAAAIGKLSAKGLLSRVDGGYEARLAYLAEMIERDNHLYPQRKLSETERKALILFLGSAPFRSLAEKNFLHAVALARESKDVLAGFFWKIFSEPFAIIHAYQKVFGTKKLTKECAGAIKKSGKFSDDAIMLAIDQNLAYKFPKELTGFLKWNVNQSPETFVAEEIFKAQRSRADKAGQ